ncbi:hypothetical protein CHELA1G11_11187 [Hyphomicrobiales bacterium]|nr:hypothetical protein CHELA1G11_11187 [Hyphomicrobiales bacterium]CAH1669513.1 hypothetical protein CHELA1G2_13121 [Hyphomicrobiales bacterium]
MTNDDFAFDMLSIVKILHTEVVWEVIAQTRHAYAENTYLIRRIESQSGEILQAIYPESLLVLAGPKGMN